MSFAKTACWRRRSRSSISLTARTAWSEKTYRSTSWPACYVRQWTQAGTVVQRSRSSQRDRFCWAVVVWRMVYVLLLSVAWCSWTGSVLGRRGYVKTATQLPPRPPSARPTLATTQSKHSLSTVLLDFHVCVAARAFWITTSMSFLSACSYYNRRCWPGFFWFILFSSFSTN